MHLYKEENGTTPYPLQHYQASKQQCNQKDHVHIVSTLPKVAVCRRIAVRAPRSTLAIAWSTHARVVVIARGAKRRACISELNAAAPHGALIVAWAWHE